MPRIGLYIVFLFIFCQYKLLFKHILWEFIGKKLGEKNLSLFQVENKYGLFTGLKEGKKSVVLSIRKKGQTECD